MRGRHAVKPAWMGKCRRGTRTIPPAGRRSFADREPRRRNLFRQDFPAWLCTVPSPRTPHPRVRLRSADARPYCMALLGTARPQPGGETRINFAAFRRTARRRMPSAPPCRLYRPHEPTPGRPTGECAACISSALSVAQGVKATGGRRIPHRRHGPTVPARAIRSGRTFVQERDR